MEKKSKNPYEVVLVALDLTEMDDFLIQYAALISGYLNFKRVYFIHVVKNLELPDDLLDKYPDLMAPLDESIRRDIKAKVDRHFKDNTIKIDYLIQEGNPIESILRLTKIKFIDLIIMGRKKSLKGSGIVSSHIARKCPCSLLLVPENIPDKIQQIVIPVDFSDHSLLALKQGIQISEKSGCQLTCSHVYKVPTGFYKTGKSYAAFAEIMKSHAQNDFKDFLRQHKLSTDTNCEYILAKDGQGSTLIYKKSKKMNADLIMIGSKGRTRASSLLIGSLAEKLIFLNHDIPILIVKYKGENMNLLEALLHL